ncbi:very-long-chain aldehyde decarbonylase CER1-like isoform X1 [Juglans microcarpa x Juglans regia]|uniref:very-long-chain aldehyde decarbonylase CER1-like isoform X1 n=1 Tax=Juglans microcarpa x Juglans regia TaxID=2249226 RepID=UPI001B7E6A6C|nr:very-long-chain aldehyde decarbonylase CER1-like isoform X1 [Juglans microcarpa x Juglans regia]
MASKPGILTDWPWKPLGNFKYVILAPWAIHGTYSFIAKGESERDLGYFLIFPFLLARMLHNQIWISLSRYRTAKGNNRIVDKGIEFEQVDRETTWDDQILFNGAIFYIGYMALPQSHNLPLWKSNGVIITALLHAGPVEFLYYWFHRALHHHFLYSRYHSHHHSSIVTEPITSVVHPFAEHIVYFMLFTIPLLTTVLTGAASIASFAGYITFIDFMNNLGHCNFEFIPKWLFSIFPPLKYLIYTPSFHSLHHTQFRTNYSLFMPLYDYVYGTMDKSTDTLYEASLKRPEESPDVVHLTHLTTPESIYHLRLGFASLASWPYSSKWYLRLLWPVTLFWSVIISGIYGHAFVLERITFKALKLQSWLVPRYNIQYMVQWQREALNTLIEEAILDAEVKGVKVISLGLLNQGEEMNRNGELYIKRYPQLKIRLVDGSSLVVALVLNSIPKGTTQVLLRGKLGKVACAIADALCESGIQVAILYNDEYEKLRLRLTTKSKSNLVISTSFTDQKIWLVGDRWTEDQEQHKAPKGTLFIPFSQFPPKKPRKDCSYQATPAMIAPTSLISNMHSCENWLPRKVMSAWRIAGILHALEGWNVHECGNTMFDIDKVWQASLRHGFQPLTTPAAA